MKRSIIETDDSLLENGDIVMDSDLLDSDLLPVEQALPHRLYLIPIRYRPIFPGIVTPLIISQGRFTDAIDKILNDSRIAGLVLIKDDDRDEIDAGDFYDYGTAVRILKKINLPDGGINVLINSISRFRIRSMIHHRRFLIADVEYLEDTGENRRSLEIKALTREVLGQLKLLSENNPLFTEEMKLTMLNVDEPGKIADFVTSILSVEKHEYQDILETLNVKKRLIKVLRLLHRELEVMTVQKRIQNRINDKIERQQKDYFLREQLKAIKQELGIGEDERSLEVKDIRKKIEALELKGEALEKIQEELEKYMLMEPTSSEYTVSRNYIDTILSLPWNKKTEDTVDLDRAAKILNKDHYGLEDVKERILEFLAVRTMKPDTRGSIICLVGPPGVGKTSLGRSIARALGRKFFRLSLGGMKDEAEIKGHRRTYIGAMPGKIIQGIKICKSNNPVFMLDEIDKLGQSFQGDPASALLEVLDPEQNVEFRDYFLDVPFDLSNVLFITTANTLDTIPSVLEDRMEIIRLSGYIAMEKYQIARRYLVPKQIKLHGLPKESVNLDRAGLLYIINRYAREAGARNLERQIERICRKTATILARGKKPPKGTLSTDKIREYLGPEVFSEDEFVEVTRPGVVVGLAWTSMGGETLLIEAIAVDGKKSGELTLTGQLGSVMTESAGIAYSYIRHLLRDNEKGRGIFTDNAIHLHVPAGATPKDGPSAGITMACCLYSLATGKRIKKALAMTGELTLTGRVLPVGGVKEKVIAAKRVGIRTIIIPKENERDLKDIPKYVLSGLHFHPVSSIEEVILIAFGDTL